ncbi:hypothetical protein L195_g018154 [Trifolium pratense]|uniref:Uncharacterized protein n=1 Tax=Trifolium pratense TaxID=57577 RepID=A0A2K3MW22_TRIPR|nr:hypothetical protein L195_g018154 [Trifolium pratense]
MRIDEEEEEDDGGGSGGGCVGVRHQNESEEELGWRRIFVRLKTGTVTGF